MDENADLDEKKAAYQQIRQAGGHADVGVAPEQRIQEEESCEARLEGRPQEEKEHRSEVGAIATTSRFDDDLAHHAEWQCAIPTGLSMVAMISTVSSLARAPCLCADSARSQWCPLYSPPEADNLPFLGETSIVTWTRPW